MGLQILFGARRPDGPASEGDGETGGDKPASEAEALVVTYLLNNDPWTQACPYSLHPTSYTLHPSPYTLHPAPFTLDPAPCTLQPRARFRSKVNGFVPHV